MERIRQSAESADESHPGKYPQSAPVSIMKVPKNNVTPRKSIYATASRLYKF